MSEYGSSLRVEVKGERLNNSCHPQSESIKPGEKAGIFVDDPTNRPMPLTGGRSIPLPTFSNIRRTLSGDSDNGLGMTSLSPAASTWLCTHCSYPNSASVNNICALCGNKGSLTDYVCKSHDDGSLATRSTRISLDDSSCLPPSPLSMGSSGSNNQCSDSSTSQNERFHSTVSDQYLPNKGQPVCPQQLLQSPRYRENKSLDRVISTNVNTTPVTPSVPTSLGPHSTTSRVNNPSRAHRQQPQHARRANTGLTPKERSTLAQRHQHDQGARILPSHDTEIIIKETKLARTTNGVVNVFRRGRQSLFGGRRASSS